MRIGFERVMLAKYWHHISKNGNLPWTWRCCCNIRHASSSLIEDSRSRWNLNCRTWRRICLRIGSAKGKFSSSNKSIRSMMLSSMTLSCCTYCWTMINRRKKDCSERGCSIAGWEWYWDEKKLITLINWNVGHELVNACVEDVMFHMEFWKLKCQHMNKFSCGTRHRVTLVTWVQNFRTKHRIQMLPDFKPTRSPLIKIRFDVHRHIKTYHAFTMRVFLCFVWTSSCVCDMSQWSTGAAQQTLSFSIGVEYLSRPLGANSPRD